jgi:hypothetical protein
MRACVALAILIVLAALALWSTSRKAEGLTPLSNPGRRTLLYSSSDNVEPRPYYVQLVEVASNSPLCGGVLIRENVVLTAAHCVARKNIDDLYCTISDDNLTAPDQIKYRFVKQIIIHPDYLMFINTAPLDLTSNWTEQQIISDFKRLKLGFSDVALLFLDERVDIRPLDIIPAEVLKTEFPIWKNDGFELFPGASDGVLKPITNDSVRIIGRGWTDRKIDPYELNDSHKIWSQAESDEQNNVTFPVGTELVIPLSLQANSIMNIIMTKADVRFKVFNGWTRPGDSGSPLLMRVKDTWYLAGVLSGGTKGEVGVANYTSAPFYEAWINETIDEQNKKPDEFITVHEIAHVVALARLKQLKKVAASSGKIFEQVFLTGTGENKTRWADLAKYLNSPSRYRSLAGNSRSALSIMDEERKKETQLAVLWALVSSPDNYKVLQEMVTDKEADASTGIPYFLRLGYTYADPKVKSIDGLQEFDISNIGGPLIWLAGCPALWTQAKTESLGKERVPDTMHLRYWEATPGERVNDRVQIRKRPAGVTGRKYLFGRPLRRRMFCDFTDALREYLATRRSWYPTYFQWNNITSPLRTEGLLECVSSDPTDYVDAAGKPKTSYGPQKVGCTGRMFQAVFRQTDFGTKKTSEIISKFFPPSLFPKELKDDPTCAWLQDGGEYWPELTATTLYDRYEWIPMPDGNRKITFREAMFLAVHDVKIRVPGGVLGDNFVDGPYMLTNGYASRPEVYNMRRYNPSFLLYFMDYFKNEKVAIFVLQPIVRSLVLERLSASLVTRANPVSLYEKGDLVELVDSKENRVRCTVVDGLEIDTPKNERKLSGPIWSAMEPLLPFKITFNWILQNGVSDITQPKSIWNFIKLNMDNTIIFQKSPWRSTALLCDGKQVTANVDNMYPISGSPVHARFLPAEDEEKKKLKLEECYPNGDPRKALAAALAVALRLAGRVCPGLEDAVSALGQVTIARSNLVAAANIAEGSGLSNDALGNLQGLLAKDLTAMNALKRFFLP